MDDEDIDFDDLERSESPIREPTISPPSAKRKLKIKKRSSFNIK